MNTVGSMLKNKRLEKKLSLDDVEKVTKIRKKFLLSIEKDDFSAIPSVSYAKGFVRNYAFFLGLDTEKALAFFRRQNKDTSKSSLLPKGMAEPLNSSLFQLTPGRFIGMIGIFLALVFLTYFGLQYKKIQDPPYLVLEKPKNNTSVFEKRIDILGQTDMDATVTINGISVLVRSDGKFFDKMELDPGKNEITVVATSRYGKNNTVIRSVNYDQPED